MRCRAVTTAATVATCAFPAASCSGSRSRALLSHAPLLLLDEPASALDPQTGRALRNALHGGARTRVIVSHDLAAVRQADQILVMDRGRIVERGTHRALLDARGLYARLWAERDRPAEEATR